MSEKEFIARFSSKIALPEDRTQCWEWKAARNSKGYGVFGLDGQLKLAHRIAYELVNGEIPEGMLVLHECDNRSCVNPDHLKLGTHADNMADMVARGRQCAGEKNSNAKLSAEKVKIIRRLYGTGHFSYAGLARVFHISPSYARTVIRGDYWKLPLAD